MKIAVVGGGIFGVTAAWHLSREGHDVDLFEKESNILQAASGINQYRLHRGYHYPRSKETILMTRDGEKSFHREYGEAIIQDPIDHFYAIANKESKSTIHSCTSMWDDCDLRYEFAHTDLINPREIERVVRVEEDLIDPEKLRALAWQKLKKYNVRVLLGVEATQKDLKPYEYVVVATYANNNKLIRHLPHAQKLYQFELCEKPVLKLPKQFQRKSIVVVDGPFMCIDPMGSTGYHVMGNVVHAIHAKNIGTYPIAPPELVPFLNRGVIERPPITKIDQFIAHGAVYFPGIDEAEHVGSMYTFRTKPPYREHDDARPTTVERVDGNIIVVFSGKIPTCVDAAEQVVSIIGGKTKKVPEAVDIETAKYIS